MEKGHQLQKDLVGLGLLAEYAVAQESMVISWYNQYKVPEDLGKAEKTNDTLMEGTGILILKVLCCHLLTKNGKNAWFWGDAFI